MSVAAPRSAAEVDPSFAALRLEARDLGFEAVSTTSVDPFSREGAALSAWLDAGRHGDMGYLRRRRSLSSRPADLVPGSLSIVTLAVNHYSAAPPFESGGRFGRVARYAWGRDYHRVVRSRLRELGARLAAVFGRPVAAQGFVDAVPLLERAAAARAGLGFVGKNTNVLIPRRGSWFFLAEILVDVALPSGGAPVAVGCGSCTRCLDACPTKAFDGAYRLDARRCISYLTVESHDPIPRDLREACGPWVFGCDVCQDVCPFNRFSTETKWPELRPESGVGPRLDLVEILSIATDAAFRARFAGTALHRTGRRGLLRNAAVAAANVGCTAAVPALVERIERDPEPLARGHALWALSRLDPRRAAPLCDRLRRADSDAFVRDEAVTALAGSAAEQAAPAARA